MGKTLSKAEIGDCKAEIVSDDYGITVQYLAGKNARWTAFSASDDLISAIGDAIDQAKSGNLKKCSNCQNMDICRLFHGMKDQSEAVVVMLGSDGWTSILEHIGNKCKFYQAIEED